MTKVVWGDALRSLAIVAGVASLLVPAIVSAQTPLSERPFQGIFTGERTRGARSGLDLSLWLAEAYDDDVYADLRQSVQPGMPQRDGYYTMLTAGVDYGRQQTGLQIGASAWSSLRYFAQTREVQTASYTAAVGVSADLPARMTLFVNQSAAYSPSYLYGLFPSAGPITPGDAPPAAPDYQVLDMDMFTYGTTAALSRDFSRRVKFFLTGDFVRTDVVHERQGYHDLSWYRARAQFSRAMTRNTSLRIAYWLRQGEVTYGTAGVTTEHSLELGTDYVRPLSPSRRATFGFTAGSSAIDSPMMQSDGTPVGLYYRFNGEARLGYQWARSWNARAVYRRGLEYVANVPEPVFNDAVTTEVTGSFTRRFDFFAFGGYSTGKSVLTRSGYFLDTYTGNARLRYAVTKHVAGYLEYLYYFYEFRGQTLVSRDVPRQMRRNGVRLGVMFSVPVLGR